MMKKNLMAMCGLLMSMTAFAQNAYDAERLMGTELNGTARFIGMGGAMSALGGDISVMGTNPAGIGIYRSNDVALSFGMNNTSAESDFNGTALKENRTRASFDQLGLVYTHKIGNNSTIRYVNFGLNYHKSKNFNKLFSMGGFLDGFSQSKYLADEMAAWGMDVNAFDKMMEAKNPYHDTWNQYPVLGVMGAMTGVVDWPVGFEDIVGWDGEDANYFSKETGGIHQYDLNVAFNIEDRVYLGATIGIYNVDYSRYSVYSENVLDDEGNPNGSYSVDNYYELEGAGVDLKLGAIFRPFESSPFRIGLAVHTPTWYDLTENYNATMSSDIYYFDEIYSQTLSDELGPEYLIYDYRLTTPWKFNVSMGTTLSGLVAVGAEYEYQDYSSASLKDVDGFELGGQESIDQFLKGVHNFRVGMETRLAPQFSLRAGYNYSTAAFSDDAYNALTLYGTSTEFNNTEAKNTITFGLGYKGSTIYADLAYKYDMYKSNFCAFDSNYNFDTGAYDLLPAAKVDNERHQLVFTLGARF